MQWWEPSFLQAAAGGPSWLEYGVAAGAIGVSFWIYRRAEGVSDRFIDYLSNQALENKQEREQAAKERQASTEAQATVADSLRALTKAIEEHDGRVANRVDRIVEEIRRGKAS